MTAAAIASAPARRSVYVMGVFSLRFIAVSSFMRKLSLIRPRTIIAIGLVLISGTLASSQQVDPALFSGLKWRLIGPFRAGRVSAGAIDPDPNTYYIGTPGGGVFKSTDGGRTWSHVLHKDDRLGSSSLIAALDNPHVMYATLLPNVIGRGAGAGNPSTGSGRAGSGPPTGVAIYKSTDQGTTWTAVGSSGLPASFAGSQAIAIAAGTQGHRLYVNLNAGLFRSDDGGDTWQRSTTDARIAGWGVIADPKNPDVLWVTQTSMYRSTDGGRTFESMAGAPSGDDFRLLWIDPRNGNRLLAGVDQGGIVSVNGGKTWSNWYNQPTAQLYHGSTDN